MGSTTNITLEALHKSYCPPLDDAVFIAIASDYDVSDSASLKELQHLLHDLKEAALIEEAADSDANQQLGNENDCASQSRTTPEERCNELTSVTSDLTDLRIQDGEAISGDLERMSFDDKTKWLKNLFPRIQIQHIHNALDSSPSLEQTVDELLSVAFISLDGEDVKDPPTGITGIEAFAEELRPQKRKGRSRKKNRAAESWRDSSAGSYRSEPSTPVNIWDSSTDDINFICTRTSLQSQTVRSVYHANGAKLSSTIRALAGREEAAWHKPSCVNSLILAQVAAIKEDYPAVPDAQIYGLLTLARNIPSATAELIDAMLGVSERESSLPRKLNGVVQYTPVDLEATEPTTSSRNVPEWTRVRRGQTQQNAATHGLAASEAFSQAATAYRKSKSDRLMGGAAAYYSSVGHEHLKAAKESQAIAADRHVVSQSSDDTLDLHGVSVEQAVRIARSATQTWFDGLGEAKYVRGGGGSLARGYKIISGTGTHSRNHAPRIGPAVFKMLVREGWKAQAFSGEIMVYGIK